MMLWAYRLGAMTDDEPIKIAAYLIHVHGLDLAMNVVMKGIGKPTMKMITISLASGVR